MMRRIACLLMAVGVCVGSQCQTGEPAGFGVPDNTPEPSPFDGVWVARRQPPGHTYDDIDSTIIISDGATRGVYDEGRDRVGMPMDEDNIATMLGYILILRPFSTGSLREIEHRYELQADGQSMVRTGVPSPDDHPEFCEQFPGSCVPLIFDRQ